MDTDAISGVVPKAIVFMVIVKSGRKIASYADIDYLVLMVSAARVKSARDAIDGSRRFELGVYWIDVKRIGFTRKSFECCRADFGHFDTPIYFHSYWCTFRGQERRKPIQGPPAQQYAGG
jgi:hypothetical protein